jgi:hypothetical protein
MSSEFHRRSTAEENTSFVWFTSVSTTVHYRTLLWGPSSIISNENMKAERSVCAKPLISKQERILESVEFYFHGSYKERI